MTRRLHAAAIAAVLSLSATAGFAQTTLVVPEDRTGSIVLSPSGETVVRRTIIEERVVPSPFRGQVRVGSVVPADVDLYAFSDGVIDEEPEIERYRYFLSPDDKIVLVEPDTRQVVRIIDRN